MASIETARSDYDKDRHNLFQAIFNQEVYPRFFNNLNTPMNDEPTVYFVGGQPGCGKSVRERFLLSELNKREPNTAIEINGDDFRAFHPDYYNLLAEDDATAASKIDKDNKFFIEKSVQASIQHKVHVVLEGTFRQPDVVESTAKLYGESAYITHGILLAVNPLLSRIGIMRRYFEQKQISPYARYTERRAHDAALQGMPETMRKLIGGGLLNEFTIVKRDGEKLFHSLLNGLSQETLVHLASDAQNILSDTHRTLTSQEIQFAEFEISVIEDAINRFSAPEAIVDDFSEIQRDFLSYKQALQERL